MNKIQRNLPTQVGVEGKARPEMSFHQIILVLNCTVKGASHLPFFGLLVNLCLYCYTKCRLDATHSEFLLVANAHLFEHVAVSQISLNYSGNLRNGMS